MTTKIKSGVIAAGAVDASALSDNSITIAHLNCSDGTNGQVLTTDGSGTLSFTDMTGGVDGIVSSADATAITIDSSENVGIGNTPNALFKLDVEGAVKTNGSGFYVSENYSSGNNVYRIYENSNEFRIESQIIGTAFDNSSPIVFATSNADGRLARMTINSDGNVGIGLTPLYSGNGTARPSLEIGGSTEGSLAFNGTGKDGLIITNSKNIGGVFKAAHTGLASAYGQTAGEHVWYTAASVSANSNQTFNERMRIDSSGVVHAKAGFGTTPVTSCSGFSGTAGYKYLIQPVGAMEPFWAVYSGDNYKSRGKGYFRWWYGYGNAATGTNQYRCEVDLVDKNLEFYEVMVEDMAGTTYAASAPAYEWAYWSTRQTFNTQSSNTNYATSSSMSGSIEAMWGQAGGHGLYNSVIGNVCSWGGLQPSDVIGAGYTGNCGTYPSTTKGVPEPYYTDCSLRLGRPFVGSASFQESTGAFSYWFNF